MVVDGVVDLITSVESLATKRRFSGAVFLGIRGAFDAVTRVIIISALEELGLGGRFHDWVKRYHEDRYIFITTEGDTKHYVISEEVPQSGVLSPTLFKSC